MNALEKAAHAKIHALIATLFAIITLSGCAMVESGSAAQAIPIGATRDQVIAIVGKGNAQLAKKRTQTTATGTREVWVLYKGPVGWGWAGNPIDREVLVTFENGVVTSITE